MTEWGEWRSGSTPLRSSHYVTRFLRSLIFVANSELQIRKYRTRSIRRALLLFYHRSLDLRVLPRVIFQWFLRMGMLITTTFYGTNYGSLRSGSSGGGV